MWSYVARGNIYELAERALRRRAASRPSPTVSAQHLQREREGAERVAAQIGASLYDPGEMRL